MSDDNRRLMTIAEAVQVLGKSERTVRRWMTTGRLPVVDTPNGKMVDLSGEVALPGASPGSAGHTPDADRQRLAAEAERLQALVSKQEAEIAGLHAQLSDVAADRDRMAGRVDDLTRQVDDLTGERDYLRSALAAALTLQTKALPAPHSRPWWQFWRREGEG